MPARLHGLVGRYDNPKRIRDVYPRSDFFPSRIRTVSIPDPYKKFKYFNQKKTKKRFLSSRKYDPGCSTQIPDPDADFIPNPDPGVRNRTLIRARNTDCYYTWTKFTEYRIFSIALHRKLPFWLVTKKLKKIFFHQWYKRFWSLLEWWKLLYSEPKPLRGFD